MTSAVGPKPRGPSLDDVRAVHASPAAVHSVLTDVLGEQGFRLTSDQLTYLEARRGSSLMGAVDKARLGIQASAWVTPQPDGCQVQLRLQYHGIPLSSEPGPQSVLREAFVDVAQSIDLALARLDPAAAFVPAILTGNGAGGPVQEEIDLGVANRGEAAAESGVPGAWTARNGVLFSFRDQLAWLHPEATQAHLAIARLALGSPGALPAELHAELEAFTVRVEQAVAAVPGGLSTVPISGDERSVLAFVHQQVRIRSSLPVRTLHRCRDCHMEKVTNPDYERAVQHSRKVRSLGGALGASITRGGITPIVLMGTLFQLNRVDPDYVCPRCQGMSAEETFVTFCDGCGELRKEAVLRTCPRCQFDFRSVLRKERFWVPTPVQEQPQPPAPTTPVPVLPYGPRGGLVCRTCGQEFASLWRIVVAPTGQPEEWFVCATSPPCTPASLADPVKVEQPA
jgi:hypothetical protein